MKLIDKDAVVSEIEKRKNENLECETKVGQGYFSARAMEDIDILSFLDTLEVKEVDLKEEIDKIWKPRFSLGWDDRSLLSVSYKGFESIAKHFFKLGLKAKGEEV